MQVLVLALALAAPVDAAPSLARAGDAACSVSVAAIDATGHQIPTRRVFASRTPAMVFNGRVSPRRPAASPLVLDVFNPKGQRYQVLVPAPRGGAFALEGSRRPAGAVEARLAVAGSSIAWTSMYGRWRVQPRFEGLDDPCGPSQAFTILP